MRNVNISVSAIADTYICTCVYMYVYVCVCVFVCIYIPILIYQFIILSILKVSSKGIKLLFFIPSSC